MQLTITGKNIEINDTLRKYVEKKIGRLDRYLANIIDGRVELEKDEGARSADDRQIAQVTLRTKNVVLRAEEATSDIFTSIDAVVDKMQRQADRYKGKRWRGRGDGISAAGEEAEVEVEEAEEGLKIARRKSFNLVPMDEMEALEQMQLLGHENFFVFYNAKTSKVNVLYRRRDGTYGLIDPIIS